MTKSGGGGLEENTVVCVNVAMTKTALDVVVCALPTGVAYNRCAAAFRLSFCLYLSCVSDFLRCFSGG